MSQNLGLAGSISLLLNADTFGLVEVRAVTKLENPMRDKSVEMRRVCILLQMVVKVVLVCRNTFIRVQRINSVQV